MTVTVSQFSKQNALRLFHTLAKSEQQVIAYLERTDWIHFYKTPLGEWYCTQYIDGQKLTTYKIKALQDLGDEVWNYVNSAKMIQAGQYKVFKPF